jgi:hypothetical protein
MNLKEGWNFGLANAKILRRHLGLLKRGTLQGEQMQPGFTQVNRKQRAFFNIRGKFSQGGYNRDSGGIGEYITHAELYNAGLPGMGKGKNCAEVKIMGKYRESAACGIGHYFGIGGIRRSNGLPMYRLNIGGGKKIGPTGGKVHVND